MVSTGDSGSAGCDNDDTQEYATDGQAVSGFASTPYNVAVGGTDFYYSNYAQGLSSLNTQIGTYWSDDPKQQHAGRLDQGRHPRAALERQPVRPDLAIALRTEATRRIAASAGTNIEAGSGGSSDTSTRLSKPSWQTGGVPATLCAICPTSLSSHANGFNASYYPICAVDGDCQPASAGDTVQISGVGGTSASSPAFAGIMALVNQKYGRQGQADYVLYPLDRRSSLPPSTT